MLAQNYEYQTTTKNETQNDKTDWTVLGSFMGYPTENKTNYTPQYKSQIVENIPVTFTDYLPDGVLGMTQPGYWIKVKNGMSPDMTRMVLRHEKAHNQFPHLPEHRIRELVPQLLEQEGDMQAAAAALPFIRPIYNNAPSYSLWYSKSLSD